MNKILILDDNKLFGKVLKQSIGHFEDYEPSQITVVANSVDAIRIVRNSSEEQSRFSVFLIDQNLEEELDGIQVMRELLSIQPDADSIIFTGYDTPEDGLRAYEAGASRYLPKPFELVELEFILKELMRSRSVRLAEARQRQQFKIAVSIAESVGALLTLEDTINAVLRTLDGVFINTKFCVLLYDSKRDSLKFSSGAQKYYEINNPLYSFQDFYPLGTSSIACQIARQTILHKSTVLVNVGDVSKDSEYLSLNVDTKSECCISLLSVRGDLLGILVLERDWRNAFDDRVVDLIHMAARHISLVVERAVKSEALLNNLNYSSNNKLKVFLCYTSQDRETVKELYNLLDSEGWIDPWLDKMKILPGQDWELAIERAVDESDVVVVCLSNYSVSKEGFVQREIRYAYDIALEKPEDAIFLIPLRLDECVVPRKLKSYQWVDFWGDTKNKAYNELVASLKLRFQQVK